MKGEIIGYAHKDIYFLETNTKSETTDLANLFAPPSGREMVNYKPRTKLKHKLNPALEFFIQNKTKKTAAAQDNNKGNLELGKCGTSAATNTAPAAAAAITASSSTTCPAPITSTATYNCPERSENGSQRSRRNSIDLYEEAASILGLTCSQTDNCKCIECQCHYFDFEEEIDFSTGAEYVMDHNSSCSIQ